MSAIDCNFVQRCEERRDRTNQYMQRLQPPQKCHIYHLRQLKQHPYLERFHTQLVPLHVQLLLRALVLQSRRLQAHARPTEYR